MPNLCLLCSFCGQKDPTTNMAVSTSSIQSTCCGKSLNDEPIAAPNRLRSRAQSLSFKCILMFQKLKDRGNHDNFQASMSNPMAEANMTLVTPEVGTVSSQVKRKWRYYDFINYSSTCLATVGGKTREAMQSLRDYDYLSSCTAVQQSVWNDQTVRSPSRRSVYCYRIPGMKKCFNSKELLTVLRQLISV